MRIFLNALAVLPWTDWAALLWFFASWIGYASFARRRAEVQPSVLGTDDKASELARELPFAVKTSVLVFDLKVLLLLGIFVYAFFRFTWSMRQYTFGALLVASAPEAKAFEAPQAPSREAFADRAGRVVGLAAETFNDGLRAYYFSFAAMGWLFSPWVFMAATLGVVWVLYRREFKSDVLGVLNA